MNDFRKREEPRQNDGSPKSSTHSVSTNNAENQGPSAGSGPSASIYEQNQMDLLSCLAGNEDATGKELYAQVVANDVSKRKHRSKQIDRGVVPQLKPRVLRRLSGDELDLELEDSVLKIRVFIQESTTGGAHFLRVYDPEGDCTYDLGSETTSGQGHQALFLAEGVLLLLGLPPEHVANILVAAGFVARDGTPNHREISRDVLGFFSQGKPNKEKFNTVAGSLIRRGKMSKTLAAELLRARFNDPNIEIDPDALRGGPAVGKILRGAVERCRATQALVPELKPLKMSPAGILKRLYPAEAVLCCIDNDNHAHAHTVAEIHALDDRGFRYSHIVPTPLLDQPYLDKNGNPWIPKGERKPESGPYLELNNLNNFPNSPDPYLVMEMDYDVTDQLNGVPRDHRKTADEAYQAHSIFYIADQLGQMPKMIVRSGKSPCSYHAWWDVGGWTPEEKLALIQANVAIGFDSCGGQRSRKFRMPCGLRRHSDGSTSKQEVVYYV